MWVWTVPLTTAGSAIPVTGGPWEPGMSRAPVLPPQPFPHPGELPERKEAQRGEGRCSAPHTHRQLPPQTPEGQQGQREAGR